MSDGRPEPEVHLELRLEPLVTVATFHGLWEAELAKARLGAEGIGSTIPNENLIRLHWGMLPAVGGVRLQVREEDAEAATEILANAARRAGFGLVADGDEDDGEGEGG